MNWARLPVPDVRTYDPLRVVTIATGTALSVALGYALAYRNPTEEAALIVAIAFVLFLPVTVRVLTHSFDLFEPVVGVSLALAVMYVARPAAMLVDDAPLVFKGYDISGQIREALAIALVAAIAFHIGYALPLARKIAGSLEPAYGRWAVDTTIVFAIGLAALGTGLFMLFIMQSGGVGLLLQMLKGRSGAFEALYRNSSAYLYGAPQLVWPAGLLLFALGLAQRRRDIVLLSFAPMLMLAIFAAGQGSRVTIIPLLLAPAVYWYLSRQSRPSLVAIVVVGYLFFTIGIAYFRETRTADVQIDRVAELKRAVLHPGYEFDQLLLKGTDNDMFESLAAETLAIPEKVKASPAEFIIRIVAKPIPSKIWKNKPKDADELLNDALYPSETSRASSSTGIVGSFFLAGELPGVFFGMLLLGVALRVPYEYWRRYPTSSTAQLFLCASLMFIPIVLRSGLSDTIVRTVYAFGPLLAAVVLCRTRADEFDPR